MTLLTRPKKTVATVIVATDGSGDYNTDGTADEVEINAAINSLPAGGGVVYMKEGTYNIDASIVIPDDNVELIGAGASTRIVTTQDITMIDVISLGIILEGISIHLLYLYGSGTAANVGISFAFGPPPAEVIRSSIDLCWIENTGAVGIQFVRGDENTVSNCKVIDNIGAGIATTGYNNFVNNQINNNTFGINLNGDGNIAIGNQLNLNSQAGIYQASGDNSIISNNIIQSCLYGILLNGDKNIITSNQCYSNTRHGISFESASHDNIISSNECIDNDVGDTGTYSGISLNQCDRNIISNNRCSGNDNYGIELDDEFSDDNIVEGNILIGNTAGAINDLGTNTQIAHNITT